MSDIVAICSRLGSIAASSAARIGAFYKDTVYKNADSGLPHPMTRVKAGLPRLGKAGFTLIEILVVAAIIVLLATAVLASVGGARSYSLDNRRIADVQQLKVAVEFYFNDHAAYPLGGAGSMAWSGTCSGFGSFGTTGAGGYIVGLAPQYITILPVEQQPSGTTGCYIYMSDGTNYKIMAYQTGAVARPKGSGFARCPASCTQAVCDETNDIAVYSSGAACW